MSDKFFIFALVKVATIGFFDGVHRGHRHLIREVLDIAEARGCESLVVTFDCHPLSVLNPEKAPKLLSLCDEKVEMLKASGVDEVYVLPFTKELAKLSARDFMERVLKKQLAVSTLVMGYNHSFGNAESGHDYKAYGEELGIEVLTASPLEGVCSSVIRDALKRGDIDAANEGLGYIYSFEGTVVGGKRVGRQIGFPTANIEIGDDKMLPKVGVYKVKAYPLGEDLGEALLGMMNVGEDTVEVHLLGFEGDLYGRNLRIEVENFVRDERHFDSLEELKAQLEKDKELFTK